MVFQDKTIAACRVLTSSDLCQFFSMNSSYFSFQEHSAHDEDDIVV
jgi:hypothetical protein